MGTRSLIAKIDGAATGRMIFCSHDSQIHRLGKMLYQEFQDPGKVDELIDLGAVYSIGRKLTPPPDDYMTDYFKYDRNEYTVAWQRDEGYNDREDFKTETVSGMAGLSKPSKITVSSFSMSM